MTDGLRFLDIFDELIIPKVVYEEIEVGGLPRNLESVDHKIVECEQNSPRFDGLDRGEAKALSLIEDMGREYVFLTDDLEARKIAEEEDIEVHGTVGVIVLAFSHGVLNLDSAIELIKKVQSETDLYITDKIVEIGIEKLKRLSG